MIKYGFYIISCIIGVAIGFVLVIATMGDLIFMTKNDTHYASLSREPVENKKTEIVIAEKKDINKSKNNKSLSTNHTSYNQMISHASDLIYTIQTGSFDRVTPAQKHVKSIVQDFNGIELSHLRIEKIGDFYSVRLGKFNNYTSADKLLQIIKPKLSTAIIMKAYIKDERIIKSHNDLLKNKFVDSGMRFK